MPCYECLRRQFKCFFVQGSRFSRPIKKTAENKTVVEADVHKTRPLIYPPSPRLEAYLKAIESDSTEAYHKKRGRG